MYSKGQKDAARYLNQYIYFSDSVYIELYNKAIAIPQGDGLAREALESDIDEKIIKKHLEQGLNHPDDFKNLIWLYKRFGDVSFMEKTLHAWKAADLYILKLDLVANEIFAKTARSPLTDAEINFYDKKISHLNNYLTVMQNQFSSVLGEAGRKVESLLFYFNLLVVFIILSSTLAVIYFMLQKVTLQNKSLKLINHELDKFVYSASHDLRAPISSLKGLVYIAKREHEIGQIVKYLDIMDDVLTRQDNFIKEIIDLSRNKRVDFILKEIIPSEIIEQSIMNHQFMEGAGNIFFEKNIKLNTLLIDEARLLILLNNLISNAIKYHDVNKKRQYIKIEVEKINGNIMLSVSDNGMGIKPEYQEKVFDMFFVTQNKSMGSGLGLYIVADVLDKIGATIELTSEWEKGTKFTIQWKDFSKS
jgi:signal transduction histidine kinase